MSAVDVRDLSVSLPGSGAVLRHVSLRVEPGECLAIVGESGAGKSVLARTLIGLTHDIPGARVTAEELTVSGRDLARIGRRARRSMRGRQVALVLQDALQSLDPLRTIESEVGETLALRRVPRTERRRRVIAALEEAGLPEAESLLRRRSGELSGGMRQRALIASAVVGGAEVLIADEPTTALDATTAVRVLDLLGRLRDEGRALVLISHDLRAVARIADRIAVLDAGRVIEEGPARDVLDAPRHDVTRALFAAVPAGPKPGSHGFDSGRSATSAQPGSAPPLRGSGRRPCVGSSSERSEPRRAERAERAEAGTYAQHASLITASGATRRYRDVTAVDDVSVDVRRGEVLGVVGESGSGKSTLARLLIGAESPDAGEVRRVATCVRLVPQDPLGSFDPRHRVERILRLSRRGDAPAPAELLRQVGLDAAFLARRPATLSGGQRQRVAIARALAAEPDVLVCDEPVSALDVTTQAGILDLLLRLQRERGLTMVFISHDLAVVRRVSDRVAVMRDGRIVESGPTEDVYASPRDPFTEELIAAGS